ncbi:hypothetical protein SCHPADRAFT_932674 [Schizopora paradoxa]|uniref:Uncharacterized protein n=1 Tax=Schizopora paradoxa TaxID=27342 RepID=A0A0H2RQK4_9AGAM|nr:hypothetical protein SCHPADRAFT_932674 [Schizopora paradoxa]
MNRLIATRNLKSTVKQIEKLCGFSETTVLQRHASSTDRQESINTTKLEVLCDTLSSYASSGLRTELGASEEILRLSVEDPVIRIVLGRLRRGLSQIVWNDAIEKVHQLWSRLLFVTQAPLNTSDSNSTGASMYMESNFESLMTSLSQSDFSFLAARYLRHAMQLQLTGNNLYLVVKLWHRYMDIAVDGAIDIEWSNMNDCISDLPSGKTRITFVSPDRFGKFAANLLSSSRIADAPNVFRTFLHFPQIKFVESRDSRNSLPHFSFSHTSIDKWEFRLLPLYRRAFLEEASVQFKCTPRAVVSRILQPSKEFIQGTILDAPSIWEEYCELAEITRLDSGVRGPLYIGDEFLSAMLSNDVETRATATFLVTSLASIDQYNWISTQIQQMGDMVDFNQVRHLIGARSLPLFDNVPYLRRFRVGEDFHITSDNVPEPPSALIHAFSTPDRVLRDFHVDTLILSGEVVMWLRVHGRSAPFTASNSRPVVAGYSQEGRTAYVAAVKVGHIYYFTTVVEGAIFARYRDCVGEVYEEDVFYVLSERGGVNGFRHSFTFQWHRLWPTKDPRYSPTSDSARKDDEALISLLNDLQSGEYSG